MENGTKMKVLWMIQERGGEKKAIWTRVGVGFVNRDGSINVQLEALPLNGGKLQLRDYVPRDAEAGDDPFAAVPKAASQRAGGHEARS
ncbi:MAG: hypothetical protein IT374_00065 [Polyangiaceae bacterium]|nr:hypothetical protein [Polyangiaceae bacterium]